MRTQFFGNTDPTKWRDESVLKDGTILDYKIKENKEQHDFERRLNYIPRFVNGDQRA